MNLKGTSRFLIDGFLYILVFPLIIRRARGEDNRAFDLPEYLINYYFQDEIKDQYHPAVTDTATLNNYNDEYPYQELLNFVKETKRILQSPNSADENRKKILKQNFGKRYSAYLKGDNSDIRCPHPALICPPIPALGLVPPPPPPPLEPLPPYPVPKPELAHTPYSYAAPVNPYPTTFSSPYRPQTPFRAPGLYNTSVSTTVAADLPRYPVSNVHSMAVDVGQTETSPCHQIAHTYRPQRLKSIDGKEHFILNLGNEFVQEIQVVQCRFYRTQCGDPTTWPETYEKLCMQSYKSVKILFSVPVNKTISILDQKLHIFEVASGCHCSLKKKSTL